jgi:hypothetical protein
VPVLFCACSSFNCLGDVFAIETFASSGKGSVTDIQHCSHYMIHRDVLPSEGFNFLQDPVLTKGIKLNNRVVFICVCMLTR